MNTVREAEPDWREAFFGWKTFLGERRALKCSLSASRPLLLHAASQRQATGSRGEAILAAMKIAYTQSLADDSTLAPGNLPVSLVNEVIRLEGRMVFNVVHAPRYRMFGDRFFSDILPTTALFGTDAVTELGIRTIPEYNWFIEADGSLHISSGSILQKFPSAENQEILVVLHIAPSPGAGRCVYAGVQESDTKSYVESQYQVWLEQYNISVHDCQFPRAIQVEFLPIGVRSEKLKVFGIILARDSSCGVEKRFGRWYKCGIYVAESLEAYMLENGDEMIVGKVQDDGSLLSTVEVNAQIPEKNDG